MWKHLLAATWLSAAPLAAETVVDGTLTVWHPLTVTFHGPHASADGDSPNPFLDYRLQVRFTGPDARTCDVPGYFDGDGEGGLAGHAWRVRFTPNRPGRWTYEASLRTGPAVAVELEPNAGADVPLPGGTGEFHVAPRDPDAPGFLKWGRLEYVGKPYLKFVDGPYWLRGGTDEPENFLAYAGFVRTPPSHTFADHVVDWKPGDPDWNHGAGRGIIGALNDLADRQVNSIYFLAMNVGGDGKDVWPWLGKINPKGDASNDNLHFDVAKLRQWEIVFDHAQRKGIFLHFVLNEAEEANKRELDDGELGTERKLYYRELVARFGHHLALEWNLCEEYNLDFDFGPDRCRAFADYLRAVDPYDHPIAVHSAGDPVEKLRFVYGDPRFALTSIQLNQRPIHEVAEAIRRETFKAGRPLPVSLDEFTLDRGQQASHIPVDDADGHRREKIWPAYFSGGMLEFILEDLLKTDSFKTPQRVKLWRYLWNARNFMERELPFWEMEPADDLSFDGGTIDVGIGKGKTVPLGPQVFARRGEVYAVYLPVGGKSGRLDVSDIDGVAVQQWYDPRKGEFVGAATEFIASPRRRLGLPPSEPDQDWVVLIRKLPAPKTSPIDTSGFRDGASHWRRIRDDSRVIQAEPDQPVYAPEQIRQIVDNILLFQRANGGWPKDYDMLAVLTPAQKEAVRATRDRSDTSFDNRNIHSQVDYLARAYARFRDESWRDACLRGLDFMLAAQYANGGFPQRFPDPQGYAAHITFNDGVMIGILNVLKDAADGLPHWEWLDERRRQQARRAVDNGVDCILKCQIRVAGVRTGWCQQHDVRTYEAAPARTFELASICPQETTEICRFLMRFDRPTPDMIAAVDDAVAWLQSAALAGIRVEKVPAPVVEFPRHRADFDVVVREDPQAKRLWARHYEIGTNRPVFAGRDAVKRYVLSEIERERRTGTLWYGTWPETLLERDYPRWRKSLSDR
jgi:PelA/Pel-15E family pectate lyase